MAIVVTSIISLIFALLFFFIKGKNNSSLILSFFFFVWSIVFISLFVATEKEIVAFKDVVVNAFALLFFPFFVALPPLVFIYTSSYLKNKVLDILPHFYIPLLVFLINTFSFLYFNFSNDNSSFLYEVCENVMTYTNYLVVLFVFPISNVFYLVKSVRLISKTKLVNKDVYLNFKWITFFVWSYLLLILFLFVAQSKIFTNVFQITFVWFIGLYFSALAYYGYKIERQKLDINLPEANFDNDLDVFDLIDKRLMHLIENEKIFLDTKLTIKKLARNANTNEKYLSNLLNKRYNKNFATFINHYRIEHAKLILLDNEYSNYTIESLATLVGFNSKSVFNATFKKATKVTPSVYRINKKGAN
ncbi:helix-turn-helix domain-containing protein [Flavobacterium sp.]|uniref:helix-turn-helix domain-containing protein n=1 Tax=Flavobacterium sp. TaxID=239 RepID=UPI003D2E1267